MMWMKKKKMTMIWVKKMSKAQFHILVCFDTETNEFSTQQDVLDALCEEMQWVETEVVDLDSTPWRSIDALTPEQKARYKLALARLEMSFIMLNERIMNDKHNL